MASAAGSEGAERAKAIEAAIVFSPEDWQRHRGGPLAGRQAGYASSGSHAGRNIELIYQRAHEASVETSLESAIQACLSGEVKHALVTSGFFVLHGLPCATSALGGSCETDGPLGALALVRALASRGVRASLFCDVHNGPVLKAGYDAMVAYLDALDAPFGAAIRANSRCLPFVSDQGPSAGQELDEFKRQHDNVFPGTAPDAASLPGRGVVVASRLSQALSEAWGDKGAAEVDCLFALERLGAPYRNIRGRDIGEHTEPVDCLWPMASSPAAAAFASEAKLTSSSVASMRALASVRPDAVTLGIGDGGNEVGMGKAASLESISKLKPGGNPEFVPLAVNGCYRSCDHLVLSTVSNWGGTAFEMGARSMLGPADVDYLGEMRRQGRTLADLEEELLRAIMASPAGAVDGIDPNRAHSVDGMDFDPHHRGLYDVLWELGGLA